MQKLQQQKKNVVFTDLLDSTYGRTCCSVEVWWGRSHLLFASQSHSRTDYWYLHAYIIWCFTAFCAARCVKGACALFNLMFHYCCFQIGLINWSRSSVCAWTILLWSERDPTIFLLLMSEGISGSSNERSATHRFPWSSTCLGKDARENGRDC